MKLILWTLVFIFALTAPGIAVEDGFVYDAKGRRDPFWPLVTSSGAIISYETDLLASDMVLEGIIAGADGSNIAIINGIIVKPSDELGNYIIQGISRNSVTLLRGSERFELKLKKEE